MRTLYYDCFSGISGDMNLGALIDVGVGVEYLRKELDKLNLKGFSLDIFKDHRKHIYGTRVTVNTQDNHHHGHHSPHRNFDEIKKIIKAAKFNKNVEANAIKMFHIIAEAEANIHNKTVNEIHFHEVGAVDSIVDIVGAAICLDYLKVEKIVASTVELGGGFVKCAHGVFPVPAPATSEILKKIPVKSGAVDKETTTPTGAAILAANANLFTDNCQMRIENTGYGIGGRDLDIPNVLRVYLGEWIGEEKNVSDEIIIEATIDDMNPELYDYVMERLFECGANDVYLTPVLMKKNRPANMISILCKAENEVKVRDILLLETTTLGFRQYPVKKTGLKRAFKTIDTDMGKVKIKYAYLDGKMIKYKPEYEDCKEIAKKLQIPIKDVYNRVMKQIEPTT